MGHRSSISNPVCSIALQAQVTEFDPLGMMLELNVPAHTTTGIGCPEKLRMPHPWNCSKPG